MLEIRIKAENLEQVIRKFKEFPDKIVRHLDQFMMKASLILEGETKLRTPVDTGRLRSSIFTNLQPLRSTISTNVDYAVYVHEDLTAYHPTGEALFMENAVKAKENELNKLLADEIKDALS